MSSTIDRQVGWILAGLLALLSLATLVALLLSLRVRSESGKATVDNLRSRIWAWWVMAGIFAFTLFIGPWGSITLFAIISFLALREYITLIPGRLADHRTLFWSFFVITPFQYWLVGIKWYGLFSILIPVYAFLFVPMRLSLAGDTSGFLDRAARIQWGLMICVYCLSYAPALLILKIPRYEHENAKLLLFLVLVVQLSDVLQYVWGKLLGKRKIAPAISPNKTWAGFIGGVGSATVLGAALWRITPFRPLQAAAMAFLITILGFAGGLTMSAIKRDRSVKDFGAMIRGHGGMLDRMDSICFSAPVFFHLTRFFFERT
jgi:phosphatidate cytidylyltransferase